MDQVGRGTIGLIFVRTVVIDEAGVIQRQIQVERIVKKLNRRGFIAAGVDGMFIDAFIGIAPN